MKIYKKPMGISTKFVRKKTSNYTITFILSLLILLTIFVLASLVITKTYVIQASGTIISPDTVYITSNLSGKVNEIFASEGKSVQKDECILTLDDGSLHDKIDVLNKSKEELENTVQSIDLFVQSIRQGNNLLNAKVHSSVYNEKINYYFNMANDTRINIDLQNVVKEKRISKINEINNEIKNNEEWSEEQINSKQNEIQQIEEEIMSIDGNIRTYNSQLNQVASQLIIDAENEKKDIESQLTEIEYSISEEQSSLDALQINTKYDGILHYLLDIKKGASINLGQTIASVTPQNDRYEIECFVEVSDRTKIPDGGKCEIRMIGVNSSKFGTLTGKITTISNDIVNKENQGSIQPFYRVMVSVNQQEYSELKKNGINIQLSMPVLVEFTYDEETYFDWFLELITSINK